MKRGEIWTVAGGPDYTGRPRPAVILQDDRFDYTDSVTICVFTTHPVDAPLFRPIVEASALNGLKAQSRIMVDKISTIPRTKLGRRIGALDDDDMTGLNRAILIFLGFSG